MKILVDGEIVEISGNTVDLKPGDLRVYEFQNNLTDGTHEVIASISSGSVSRRVEVGSTPTPTNTPTPTITPTITPTPTPPSAPTNFQASSVSYDSVTLTWDSVDNADNYTVYRNSSLLARGLTDTTYTDNTVSPETDYYYEVSATNSYGESPASSVTVTTTSLSCETECRKIDGYAGHYCFDVVQANLCFSTPSWLVIEWQEIPENTDCANKCVCSIIIYCENECRDGECI